MDNNNSYENTLGDLLRCLSDCGFETREMKGQKSMDAIQDYYDKKITACVYPEKIGDVSDYINNLAIDCEEKAYALGFSKAMDIMIDYISGKSTLTNNTEVYYDAEN